MKKISFLMAVILGFAFQAMAINPYAFGVSATLSGSNVSVNYSLNTDAAAVALQFCQADQVKASVALTAVTKGAHNETVAVPATLVSGDYTLKVAATGTAHELDVYRDETLVVDNRMHGTVDPYPASPAFGTIYLAARTGAAGAGRCYYRATPDYTVNTTAWNPYTTSSVGRPAVASNGLVYMAEYGDGNSGVWVYNPSTDACTQFFQGTRNNLGLFVGADGAEQGCSTPGIAIYGEGANAKLYLAGEDFGNSDSQPFHIAIYNIGNADGSYITAWDAAPSVLFPLTDGANGNFCLAPTKDGVFVGQNRAAGSNAAGMYSLQFYTNEGVCKYQSTDATLINGSLGAGVMYDEANNKLFTSNGDGNLMVFSVTWAADATPTLALDTIYTLATKSISQMTYDFAGNIVAVTGANGYATSTANCALTVISLPAAEAPVAATPIAGSFQITSDAPEQPMIANPIGADGRFIVKYDCENGTWAEANPEIGETFTFAVDVTGSWLEAWLAAPATNAGAQRGLAINKWTSRGDLQGDAVRFKHITGNIWGMTANFAQQAQGWSAAALMNDSITTIYGQLFGFEYTETSAGAAWWQWDGHEVVTTQAPGADGLFQFAPSTGKIDPDFMTADMTGSMYGYNVKGYAEPCATLLPPVGPTYEHLYEIGDNQGWKPEEGIELTKTADNVFEGTFTFTAETSWFAFTTVQSEDWTLVNASRFGGANNNELIVVGQTTAIIMGGDGNCLTAPAGSFKFVVDLNQMTVAVSEASALDNINANDNVRKVIENGHVYIIRNGVRYTISGAVVE